MNMLIINKVMLILIDLIIKVKKSEFGEVNLLIPRHGKELQKVIE